jgi:hypothetical protein
MCQLKIIFKKERKKLGMVAQDCNPSYLGSRKWEVYHLKQFKGAEGS